MNVAEYEEYLEGDHWQGVRTKTLKLADGRCQRCGDLADDCHHTTYRSLGHEVPGVDVVAVCRPCHDYLHGRNTHDPAAEPPDREPEHEDVFCVACGYVAEVETDDQEPICKKCWRKRYAPE